MRSRNAFIFAGLTAIAVTAFQNCSSGGLPQDAASWNSNSSQASSATNYNPANVASAVQSFGFQFGGMYSASGTSTYNNNITGGQSCPTGYTANQVFGATGYDAPIFVCTAPLATNSEPQYDFGGVYGKNSSGSNYNNPATGAQSCASGFTAVQVHGSSGAYFDFPLYYCIRTHSSDPTGSLIFAGFYGEGTNNSYFLDPVNGEAECPAGSSTFTALGSPAFDFEFYSCYSVPSGTTLPSTSGSSGGSSQTSAGGTVTTE